MPNSRIGFFSGAFVNYDSQTRIARSDRALDHFSRLRPCKDDSICDERGGSPCDDRVMSRHVMTEEIAMKAETFFAVMGLLTVLAIFILVLIDYL